MLLPYASGAEHHAIEGQRKVQTQLYFPKQQNLLGRIYFILTKLTHISYSRIIATNNYQMNKKTSHLAWELLENYKQYIYIPKESNTKMHYIYTYMYNA